MQRGPHAQSVKEKQKRKKRKRDVPLKMMAEAKRLSQAIPLKPPHLSQAFPSHVPVVSDRLHNL